MIFHQLAVIIENKPGSIARITSLLAKEKINMRALTISSHGSSGLMNLLVDDPHAGEKILKKAGVDVKLTEVIAVVIDDRPGGADNIIQLLSEKGINIENAYGFVLESRVKAVMVIETSDIKNTMKVIEESGFKTLNKEVLLELEPFHYMKY